MKPLLSHTKRVITEKQRFFTEMNTSELPLIFIKLYKCLTTILYT